MIKKNDKKIEVQQLTTVIYSLGHGLCAPFLQCLGQLSLLPSVER